MRVTSRESGLTMVMQKSFEQMSDEQKSGFVKMRSGRSVVSFVRRTVVPFMVAVLFSGVQASAQTTIVISDPGRTYPIALPQLCLQSGESQAAQQIPAVVARDLDLSGYFSILSPNAYVEPPGKCVGPDGGAYEDWALIKAQWLVRGVVSEGGSGFRVVLELHDVPSQRRVFSKEYSGSEKEIRRIAHQFANEIMREITGEAGPFGSRVAFAARIGRFKDLFVMDLDGENLRQVTTDRGIATAPAWDRAGQRLLFTSYRTRQPNIYVLDVDGGRTSTITTGPALEIGGTFSPDGSRIVTSLTENRDSDLVEFTTQGQLLRRLTRPNQAIDVSPSFSPDGQKIVFCSDRGGGPQIYTMGWNGEKPQRISFTNSSYCTSPSWSPKGDRIAFVCRADGGFQLFMANADGSDPIQVTGGGDNEDPDWSPDGRYLVYSSTFGKRGGNHNLAMIRVAKNLEGTNQRQITFGRGSDSEPAWSTILP